MEWVLLLIADVVIDKSQFFRLILSVKAFLNIEDWGSYLDPCFNDQYLVLAGRELLCFSRGVDSGLRSSWSRRGQEPSRTETLPELCADAPAASGAGAEAAGKALCSSESVE